jgi:hypothetical protein
LHDLACISPSIMLESLFPYLQLMYCPIMGIEGMKLPTTKLVFVDKLSSSLKGLSHEIEMG